MRRTQSEIQYLENESAAARAAIKETIEALKQTIGRAANPVVWTRRHPWVAVSIAAAAGLVAGRRVRGSGRGNAPEDVRAVRRSRRAAARQARAIRQLYEELTGQREAEGRRTWSRLLDPFQRAIVRMLKIALKAGFTAFFSTPAPVATVNEPEDDRTPFENGGVR